MSEWQDDDEVTITFRTLRQSQAEAMAYERERILEIIQSTVWVGETLREDIVNIVAAIKDNIECRCSSCIDTNIYGKGMCQECFDQGCDTEEDVH